MATWETVLARAKSVAFAAERKTEQLVENAKIKMEIAELQREIASLYEGLGRLLYDGRQSGESIDDMVDACLAHLKEQNEYLEQLQDRLLEGKSAVRCAECGTVNDDDSSFCKKCGKEF